MIREGEIDVPNTHMIVSRTAFGRLQALAHISKCAKDIFSKGK